MIVLFTDFGTNDPYVGQMHAVLRKQVEVTVIDLLHHAPSYNVKASAFLLDALQRQFQAGDIFVCVVDPGVGGDRAPLMVQADGKWYVGPDNGLLNMVCLRAETVDAHRIDWRPDTLSTSFHGRDLFAPVAAGLARGVPPAHSPWTLMGMNWPDELAEIIYVDHYGNAMTGIRAGSVSDSAQVRTKDRVLKLRTTFSSARDGEAFWYRNSLDLVEIALREDSAAIALDLKIGDEVELVDLEPLLS